MFEGAVSHDGRSRPDHRKRSVQPCPTFLEMFPRGPVGSARHGQLAAPFSRALLGQPFERGAENTSIDRHLVEPGTFDAVVRGERGRLGKVEAVGGTGSVRFVRFAERFEQRQPELSDRLQHQVSRGVAIERPTRHELSP
jgi:hypothetical protein